jgi:hypothetical protein
MLLMLFCLWTVVRIRHLQVATAAGLCRYSATRLLRVLIKKHENAVKHAQHMLVWSSYLYVRRGASISCLTCSWPVMHLTSAFVRQFEDTTEDVTAGKG